MGTTLLRRARRHGDTTPVDLLLRDGVLAQVAPTGSLGVDAGAEVVDLDGRWVIPGLWDQHTHLTQWALARTRLDLSAATSAAQVVAQVRARLAAAPPAPGTALVGHGFRDGLWPDVPTAALLDAVAGDVPVVLVSGDLHCAWLSTAGLRFLGVHEHATGVLRESEWIGRMGVVDAVTPDAADAMVADGLEHVATLGVVGVLDLEVADNVEAWRRRARRDLPVRVRAGVWEQHLDSVLAEGLRTGDPLDR
ncbi:MAG: amidohydrolase family protein, partial [Cellulomonadaceae bacterium]|nr:amidohydrolase family protein [Cellulomonadaceae bacterium]